MLGGGGIEIAQDLGFVNVAGAIDVPAIAVGAPAVEVEAAEDWFAVGGCALVVAIDFGINFLHPSRLVVLAGILAWRAAPLPIIEAVTFGHIEREAVECLGNAEIDPIFIDIKTGVKTEGAELVSAVDIGVMVPTRADMKGDAIQRAGVGDGRQHLVLKLDPGQGLTVGGIIGAADIL